MSIFSAVVSPDWSKEGWRWPNRETSRFVRAADLRWHVQIMGLGPPVVLLHGAGAATHSWRDLAPLLARHFTVVAPDLPGHGFTETPAAAGLSLNGMGRSLAELLAALEVYPALTVGHSAGAALALRMALDGRLGEGGVVSLNGALQPFPGPAGHIFPAMAKLLLLNPLARSMFAWRAAQPGVVERLLERTGSSIDPVGVRSYAALLCTTGHVAGTLGMMAEWDLHELQSDLRRLSAPLTLVAAEGDRAVPPRIAAEVHGQIPHSRLIRLPGLGHLAHEEAPGLIADIVIAAASRQSVRM